MRRLETSLLDAPPSAPQLRLLDAATVALDERGLRAWAREESLAVGAPYTSRCYRHPHAVVAWHSEPLGVDIERIEPLGEGFAESICTPRERQLLGDRPRSDAFLASLWSGKEALAKALGDALRYDPRHLESPLLWPDAQAGRWRATQLQVPAGHVGWLCWRASATRAAGVRVSPRATLSA
jgi:4'-phosphopantetheinyl transferase superfamily